MATLALMLLALVFVPFYFRSQITTLPEYLEERTQPIRTDDYGRDGDCRGAV